MATAPHHRRRSLASPRTLSERRSLQEQRVLSSNSQNSWPALCVVRECHEFSYSPNELVRPPSWFGKRIAPPAADRRGPNGAYRLRVARWGYNFMLDLCQFPSKVGERAV